MKQYSFYINLDHTGSNQNFESAKFANENSNSSMNSSKEISLWDDQSQYEKEGPLDNSQNQQSSAIEIVKSTFNESNKTKN